MEFSPINNAAATPALATVTLNRVTLASALAIACKVIERRNTIPILSNVLIRIGADSVTVQGTDLDLQIVQTLPHYGYEAVPGAFTVPAATFADAVKACDGDSVTLAALEGGRLAVNSGRARFVLVTLPIDDFPVVQAVEKPCTFELPPAQLLRDWTAIAPAISSEETRYYLNGIFMQAASDGFNFAATDGHRLYNVQRPVPAGIRMEPATDDSADEALPDAIIPCKLVGLVLSILKAVAKDKAAAPVRFAVSKSKVELTIGNIVLLAKLIDGTFPDFRRVIPTGNDKPLAINPGWLGASVARVAKMSSERTRAIKMTLAADKVTLSIASVASGVASEEVPADYSSEGFEIGFNATYLAQIMGVQPKAEDMHVQLADAAAPTLFTFPSYPEFRAVLMPMRVDGCAIPAAKRVEPAKSVEQAHEAFRRIYAAAWEARDGQAMAAVCAYYKHSMREASRRTYGETSHVSSERRLSADLAYECKSTQRSTERGEGKHTAASMRRARGKLRVDTRRGNTPLDEANGWYQLKLACERVVIAAKTLERIGFNCNDPRDIMPVRLRDGKRVFVAKADLAKAPRCAQLHKADGSHAGRRRSSKWINIEQIAEIIQPRGKAERQAIADAIAAANAPEPVAINVQTAIVDQVGSIVDQVTVSAAERTANSIAVGEAFGMAMADYAKSTPIDAPAAPEASPEPETPVLAVSEPSSDVAALVATVEGLLARVAVLEAGQRGERVAKPRTGVRLLMVKRYLAMRADRKVHADSRAIWAMRLVGLENAVDRATALVAAARAKRRGTLVRWSRMVRDWKAWARRNASMYKEAAKRADDAEAAYRAMTCEADKYRRRCEALEAHAAASSTLDRRPDAPAVPVAPGSSLIILPTVPSRPRVEA